MDRMIEDLVGTVIGTLVVLAIGAIGIVAGPFLWFGYGLLYWHFWHVAQQHAANAVNGMYPEPTTYLNIPNLWIVDGDITDRLTWTSHWWIPLAVICAIGLFIGNWRFAKAFFWVFAPLCFLPVWLDMVGLHHYYPGGEAQYFKDHYEERCKPSQGQLLLTDCRFILVKKPPF